MKVRVLLYLVVVHLVGLLAILWLLPKHPWYLFASEGVLLLSFLLGLRFWNQTRITQRLLRDGTAALRDQDYNLRLREVGVNDVDELIRVYNQLLEKIRIERLDNQRQQFFLSLLVDSTALGIITLDFDGGIFNINDFGLRQLGLPQDAKMPNLLSDLQHPIARELQKLSLQDRRLIRLSDGTRYRIESAEFVDRGFRRRFLVINDLSGELNAAEVAAYGKVIRMMAHEVNNTTAASRSVLQSLIDTEDLDDGEFRELAAEYLPLLTERGESLNQFMRRFAEVVRLPDPDFANVDLKALLDRQALLAGPVCQQHGIQITSAGPQVEVRADETLLQQVLVNAITNARESILEAREQRPQVASYFIKLTTTLSPPGFVITDNGAGISIEAAPLLFTPFFSTKATGQGIGLTLMRDILDRHGANYELQTNANTGHTELTVSFK